VEAQAKSIPNQDINDEYMEMMVSFALICLFGTVLPSMSVLLLIANLFELRLLAYRCVRSTAKPRPAGAEDIGAWEYCFDFVTQISLICMPCLLVFEMHPLRDLSELSEMEAFLVLEHGFILIKLVAMAQFTKVPFDVRKMITYMEDKTAELFSSSSRGLIQLPAKHLGANPTYTPKPVPCGPEAK
jgi:hypothetical protein